MSEAITLLPWQESLLDYIARGSPNTMLSSDVVAEYHNRHPGDFSIRVDMGRRGGHTTVAIEALRRHPGLCVVVPTPSHAVLYPEEVRDRVISAMDFPKASQGRGFTKCVTDGVWEKDPLIDEVRRMPWSRYAELGGVSGFYRWATEPSEPPR